MLSDQNAQSLAEAIDDFIETSLEEISLKSDSKPS